VRAPGLVSVVPPLVVRGVVPTAAAIRPAVAAPPTIRGAAAPLIAVPSAVSRRCTSHGLHPSKNGSVTPG
jgi:hypothetical protein